MIQASQTIHKYNRWYKRENKQSAEFNVTATEKNEGEKSASAAARQIVRSGMYP